MSFKSIFLGARLPYEWLTAQCTTNKKLMNIKPKEQQKGDGLAVLPVTNLHKQTP